MKLGEAVLERMKEDGYGLSADDMFALKTQDGLPLECIVEFSKDVGFRHLPWYGYARRMWQSGSNRENIVADIKQAIQFCHWPEKWPEVRDHLRNLWPELEQ